MNRLQSKILDIFKVFLSVCEKLDLKYYMFAGTAIGTLREEGFIPWDDDLDVAMPRDDYEIFIKEAQKYLPQNIFLQTYKTEKNFPRNFAKLRDSNTTFIESGMKDLKINHGVFLDIFPLDTYPELKELPKIFRIKEKFYKYATLCALDDKTSYKIRLRNKVFRFFGFHKRTDKSLQKFEKFVFELKGKPKYYTNSLFINKETLFDIEWFADGVSATFEGLQVIVPAEYDKYLTNKYDNWRERPPLEQQKSHHLTTIIDLDKPYTEYIK